MNEKLKAQRHNVGADRGEEKIVRCPTNMSYVIIIIAEPQLRRYPQVTGKDK